MGSFWDGVAAFIILMAFTCLGWFLLSLLNGFHIPILNKDYKGVLCHFKIPVLIGMIIMGMIARNTIEYMDHYEDHWGKLIREVCLTIIIC
jgi:uncharacterized membrane protein (DUF485 family)